MNPRKTTAIADQEPMAFWVVYLIFGLAIWPLTTLALRLAKGFDPPSEPLPPIIPNWLVATGLLTMAVCAMGLIGKSGMVLLVGFCCYLGMSVMAAVLTVSEVMPKSIG